ncbi:hypothetical protein [Aequorivita sublithincola]|uniref:hypothetical protein n=1 Tax=Aequorivita sublithincola TaxID=101385 RepID=UPI0012FBE2CE|nr:hypothetical protein [Aequorivita sublithincola]
MPLSPGKEISRTKYIAFKQFELAGRYMFTEKFGAKGHYAFNRFENPNDNTMGISMNRVGLEGVANVGRLLNVDYRLRERIGLLFHTGVGVSFARPSSVSGTDHIGNFLIGFTGEIKLNERISFFGDMTYIRNFKQHYGYNGELLNANYDAEAGSFVNVSIGIMYSFGQKKYHADWY